jgi:phosphoribosylaminoimidazole-succinocarboxamide synthase
VRQWLISQGFQGKEGQKMPEMTDEVVASISDRYIELYEKVSGETFVKDTTGNIEDRIYQNIINAI